MTVKQVNALVDPKDDSVSAVESWLSSHGISKDQLSYSAAKDWIEVSVPVSQAETLLKTKYSVYQDADGDKLTRTSQYSLPRNLHEHVDLVLPTNSFVTGKRAKSSLKTKSLAKRKAKAGQEARSAPVDLSQGEIASTGAVNVSGVCNATNVTPTCLRTLYGTIDYKPQVPGKNKVGLCDYLGEVREMPFRYGTDYHDTNCLLV